MNSSSRRSLLLACVLPALLVLALVSPAARAAPAEPGSPQPVVLPPVAPAVFHGDLRRIPGSRPVIREDGPAPLAPGAAAPIPAVQDPVRQASAPSVSAPAPLITFAGLSFNPWGAGWPPDTNGDVGPVYYLQTVNTSLGVFRKSDGALLSALTLDSLFSQASSGTPCDNNNRGDPVVLYDPLADRWIVSDFAWANISTGPMYECMAVSRSGDPVSGGWYFYPWQVENGALLPDYPKLGVWPDGIYMSVNLFSGNNFQNVQVWAFNRTDMEAGLSTAPVAFDLPAKVGGVTVFSLLPSNMRGVTGVPPAGRENLFASIFGGFSARIWKFHVDWSSPASSTLTGPTNVTIAAFNAGPPNVPELGGNNLDTLTYRLMMQNQYTRLGGAESLWLAHTVGSGGATNIAQVRWYQLDVTGGAIATSPVQQSTWAPDARNRFMPSLAVDQNGDMAIGYSVSDSSLYPSIRYAGRLSADALDTLGQGETSLVEGTGFQCCTFSNGVTNTRWGDYSAMTIDPDGCTFWYTNEFYATQPITLAQDNWQTRIGAFRLPSCLKQNTALSVAPASGPYGGTANLTATLSAGSVGLPGQPVTFTLDGASVGSALTGPGGVASLPAVSLAGIGAGTYLSGVVAVYAGDATYNGSSGANSLTVAKAAQTIAFGPLPARTYGDPPFAITATASSGLVVAFASGGGCSVALSTVSLVAAGACTITATQPGNLNYLPAPATAQSFAIARAAASVVLGDLQQTYDGSPRPASATTAPPGLSVALTYDGVSTPPTDAGSYAVAAEITDPNYQGSATGTLVVARAAATLTLGNLNQIYNGAPRPVSVTTSPPGLSGVGVLYDGQPPPPVDAGAYAVTASLANPNYSASVVSGTLIVARADQTITFDPLPDRVYGTAPFTLTASASSGLPVDFAAGGACALTGRTLSLSAAGLCTVTATQSGGLDYNPAPALARVFTISPAAAALSLGNLVQAYDGTPKAVVVTTSPPGLSGVAVSYDGSPIPPTAPGQYAVQATLTNPDYQAAAVSGTLLILPPRLWLPFVAR